MPIRPLFKRQDPPPSATGHADADEDVAVAAARSSARRRLTGAVVLLAVGVVTLPLLFDSKPRPVPGDVRVELRRAEGTVTTAPLRLPPVVAPPPEVALPGEAASATGIAAPAPAAASTAARSEVAAAGSAAGSAPAAAAGGRFVVQVGAFTDPVALREARQRVEKLGLKTYTQVIENDAGRRTRVRVGPFETRAEAEAAGVKIKAAGLPAYLLTL
jgi:DedD protein